MFSTTAPAVTLPHCAFVHLGTLMAAPLSFVRLRPDTNGASHFEPLSVDVVSKDFAPPATPFFVSEFAPASQCGFLKPPAGWVGDTHPSPIRMWVFFLSGEMEFEASDGERRKCVPARRCSWKIRPVTVIRAALLETTMRSWRWCASSCN